LVVPAGQRRRQLPQRRLAVHRPPVKRALTGTRQKENDKNEDKKKGDSK